MHRHTNSPVMNLKLNEQKEEVLLVLMSIMSISKAALRVKRVDWVKLVRDGIK